MKKLTALILIACMAAALFAGCGTKATTPANIGTLQGPTGMGMVTLMGDEFSSKYNITIESAPDAVVGKIINGVGAGQPGCHAVQQDRRQYHDDRREYARRAVCA